mgnify:CR=1 FL=1
MLEKLTVSNFALIEEVEIEFSAGLNVFTGETGAGKSIVLDAVGAILGARSSIEYIRSNTDCYCIQAKFNITSLPEVKFWLDKHEIEYIDNELLLMRRLNRSGRNAITANAIQIPLNKLKELGSLLIDIHAQHHSQLLLQSSNHLSLLDTYGDTPLYNAKQKYDLAFDEYRKLEEQLTILLSKVQQREQSMDILRWQISEIETVKPRINEYEDLQAESKRLSNMDKMRIALENANYLLDNDKIGIINNLYKLSNELKNISKYENKFDEILSNIQEWQYLLTDTKEDISTYYDNLEQSPKRLEEVQKRIDEIYKLYKKHGNYEQTIAFLHNAQAEYNSFECMDEQVATLKSSIQKSKDSLFLAAANLTKIRTNVASKLSKDVQKHIRDLAMPAAIFEISIHNKTNFTADGCDDVLFLFSANVGQEARAVNKIASGGEVSRIFLALKTVLMSKFQFATMIFDEVDTGVSGTTAQRMAEKLFLIACSVQTICVTHLPQVACMADVHIKISKNTVQKQTITRVHIMNHQERITEISNIMVGDNQTELTRNSAAQMLEWAFMRKNELNGTATGGK